MLQFSLIAAKFPTFLRIFAANPVTFGHNNHNNNPSQDPGETGYGLLIWIVFMFEMPLFSGLNHFKIHQRILAYLLTYLPYWPS